MIYEKYTTMIIKVNTAYFHSKIVNKPKMSTFITSIQYCAIGPSWCNKARKMKASVSTCRLHYLQETCKTARTDK